MRQAGRSLPEYRKIKAGRSLLEICLQPELCAEVTLQPVRRYDVDAAILYADIMHPLVGIGIDLQIREGIGPVIAQPIRTSSGVARLRPLEPDALQFVTDDIRCVLNELGGALPLLGFSGAPFTLASYLVEGQPTRDFRQTKRLMYSAPDVWHDLMTRLADIVVTYCRIQAEAGIHGLQIFDSWAGVLSLDDYCRFVQPYTCRVFTGLRALHLPLIHFGTDTGGLLEALADSGGDAIGIDWRVPLDVAWQRIGLDRGIQGNLDPLILQAPWPVLEREARAILSRAANRPGHIFNTGHGLHPDTPPDQVARLVDLVHEVSGGGTL
jgi:uroporphyrinogen decarboxylase